jgi:hypothetical protein
MCRTNLALPPFIAFLQVLVAFLLRLSCGVCTVEPMATTHYVAHIMVKLFVLFKKGKSKLNTLMHLKEAKSGPNWEPTEELGFFQSRSLKLQKKNVGYENCGKGLPTYISSSL